ncbi:toll/interleukin-1 receptor domain-containing protein [Streptacidiphilus pinicola]|uniref:Toll/interleukin-1 receptor domain-containing protein n=1 Tax=Streptacidiphilus pinicola TaxID=2219663 RepID=A0A2X0IQ87_9ACTN|nr:toll/interleukin-1 receptor domain-containing protein [Streptacidiphilus pinicola]RAG87382.1 toll/interleukin-1 receptor domain-containing protein [Streptacidiphilus pinicola]
MPDVFINYRTGDGEKTAALIERELSHRFGGDRIFRASKSIRPGKQFPRELLNNVRACSVLLAVIGDSWFDVGSVYDEDDWVRRELLAAHEAGATLLPVLEGRRTDRLSVEDFPSELQILADTQSLRLDLQDADAGLRRIGDELADLVPALRRADTAAKASPADTGSVQNTIERASGPTVQARDITGDVTNTVIKGNRGPLHTGRGDINQFSGDGAFIVRGGKNRGRIGSTFNGPRRTRDDER